MRGPDVSERDRLIGRDWTRQREHKTAPDANMPSPHVMGVSTPEGKPTGTRTPASGHGVHGTVQDGRPSSRHHHAKPRAAGGEGKGGAGTRPAERAVPGGPARSHTNSPSGFRWPEHMHREAGSANPKPKAPDTLSPRLCLRTFPHCTPEQYRAWRSTTNTPFGWSPESRPFPPQTLLETPPLQQTPLTRPRRGPSVFPTVTSWCLPFLVITPFISLASSSAHVALTPSQLLRPPWGADCEGTRERQSGRPEPPHMSVPGPCPCAWCRAGELKETGVGHVWGGLQEPLGGVHGCRGY